ncbi:hypothetical protein GCM10011389_32180 [Pontibacillus salipaludis]|uniref:Uncharacterized protein n=1 Tax=Pontibacillus salipaludis TaxID=1697394 RepID=A0ABQ1QBN1_9BACI|nr:hypothetical protein GCM10011389_32180 [Pontibacillus salipaludis]
MKKRFTYQTPKLEPFICEFKTRKRERELIEFARFSNHNLAYRTDPTRFNFK